MYRLDVPEDLVRKAKEKLADVWEGKDATPALLLFPSEPALPPYSVAERVRDPAKDLECEILSAEKDLRSLIAGFCNIPSIWPYMGVGVLPSAFGCEIVMPDEGDPWTRPLFYDAADVHDLEKPDLVRSNLTGRVLERIEYFQQHTERGIPVRLTDVQSPMDVAIQVWNYQDIMVALYENPAEVHRLLDLITESLIEFIHLQASRVVSFLGYTHVNLWRPRGIYVSDDVTAILSPEIYDRFIRPYNERLSREFGGISIHCCGKYEQNLSMVASLDGFMSFDADSASNDPKAIVSVLEGRKGVWHTWASDLEEAERKLDMAVGRFGLILNLSCKTLEEGVDMKKSVEEKAMRLARSRGL
ncbi:MAG: uroporphyrinogen decarboxylase family protein [Bacillota bacterium]